MTDDLSPSSVFDVAGDESAGPAGEAHHDDASPARQRNGVCMVVGGNRGIGLALVEGLLNEANTRQVVATYRLSSDREKLTSLKEQNASRLSIVPLDVTDDFSLAAFSNYLQTRQDEKRPGLPELVVHSAGILHGRELESEKTLEQCSPRKLLRMFEVNSIGPLMVARALLPLYDKQRPFVFAALSAMVGSIGDNRLGGWYGYRASKSALNQFVKTLSNECRHRFPQAAIVAVHPGTTDTDLSRPFQRGVKPGKLYSPPQSATRILDVIKSLDARQNGRFFNWDGGEIPW